MMKIKWAKRLLALVLVLLMLPVSAFAADITPEQTISVAPSNGFSATSGGTLRSGKSMTVKVTKVPTGKNPKITVSLDDHSSSVSFTVSDSGVEQELGQYNDVKVEWSDYSNLASIIISADEFGDAQQTDIKNIEVIIEGEDANEYTVQTSESNTESKTNGTFKSGESTTLATITPQRGYKLSKLTLQYTSLFGNSDSTPITGTSSPWHGITVSFNATGETIVSGPLYGNLKITPETESTAPTYSVRIYVDDGLDLTKGRESQTVEQGDSVTVQVEADSGYLLDNLVCRYGKKYAYWTPGQTYLQIDNEQVRVTESRSGDRVSFTLYDIAYDMTLEFTSTYDSDNLPIEINEGTHIRIDSDCGDTVGEGEDVTFRIWPTSSRYSVRRVTLEIGDKRGSANPENDDYIRVGNRSYDIERDSDGEVSIFVEDVREPITISASSNSSSSSSSRPSITINSASNMTITKNVSGSYVDEGDDVTFYFTPKSNYKIDQITVTVGGTSRSAHADERYISVAGDTYDMYLDSSSGRLTLYVTDIEKNIRVTGKAAYVGNSSSSNNNNNNNSNNSSQGSLRLNTSGSSSFLNGYSDGTFRPSSPMTRGEAAQMLYRLTTGNSSTTNNGQFYDVPSGSWYSGAICALAAAGVVDSGGYFWPDASITRAELCDMLYRLNGSPSTSGSDFRDTRSHRLASAIRYCSSRGWVNGYQDGSFRPDGYITRAEVAAVMVRALGRNSSSSYTNVVYRDVPSNHWAYRYICIASSGG